MADKAPALARVLRTSYLNDVLHIVENGEEGPLVAWPKGVDPADAGDNIVACDEEGKPLAAKKSKAADPTAPAA